MMKKLLIAFSILLLSFSAMAQPVKITLRAGTHSIGKVDSIWHVPGVDSIFFRVMGITYGIKDSTGNITYTFNTPLQESGSVVSLLAASAIQNGYLSASDYIKFTNKVDTIYLNGTGDSLKFSIDSRIYTLPIIAAAASVADANYGEITVTGSGTSWTINNNAVTNVKINDVAWSKITGTPTSLSGYGITDPVVLTSGSYSNPSWITDLSWSKITSTPNTLSAYGITDAVPLSFKTTLDALNGLIKGNGSGTYSAITDNSTNWNTAYGWGNHASAGYATTTQLGAKLDTTTGYVTNVVLNTPNVLYSTPVTFTTSNHNASGTLSLINAGSYTVFGNQTNASAQPSYGKLHINSINATGTPSSTTALFGDGTWKAISGSTNTSVGSSYKVAIDNTNNIKSIRGINGALIDSSTANTITVQIDSNLYATKWYAQNNLGYDTTRTGTYVQRSAITSPYTGYQFYQTNAKRGNYIWSGTNWTDGGGYNKQYLTTFQGYNGSTGYDGGLIYSFSGSGANGGPAAANNTDLYQTGNFANMKTGTTSTGKSGYKWSLTSGSQPYQYMYPFYQEWEIILTQLSNGTDRFIMTVGDTGAGRCLYFKYSDDINSGNWQCITKNGGANSIVNTSVAATTNKTTFGIYYQSTSSVYFYINNVQVGNITTNIPIISGSDQIMFLYKTVGTTNVSANCQFFEWRRY